MQGNDFKLITDGIKKVIDAEQGFLSALPVDVITLEAEQPESVYQTDTGAPGRFGL